jgi:hypothetical protein
MSLLSLPFPIIKVYEDEESGRLHRANSFELIAGKNLEVTIRGISKIEEDECTNSYPPGCVPNNFGFSSAVSKFDYFIL